MKNYRDMPAREWSRKYAPPGKWTSDVRHSRGESIGKGGVPQSCLQDVPGRTREQFGRPVVGYQDFSGDDVCADFFPVKGGCAPATPPNHLDNVIERLLEQFADEVREMVQAVDAIAEKEQGRQKRLDEIGESTKGRYTRFDLKDKGNYLLDSMFGSGPFRLELRTDDGEMVSFAPVRRSKGNVQFPELYEELQPGWSVVLMKAGDKEPHATLELDGLTHNFICSGTIFDLSYDIDTDDHSDEDEVFDSVGVRRL